MVQRIIFGAVYAVLAICLFLFATPFVTGVAMAVIAIMAVTEFLKATSVLTDISKLPLTIITYVFSFAFILEIIQNLKTFDNINSDFIPYCYGNIFPIIIVYIIILFAIMVLNHPKITFSQVSFVIIGNIYITVSLMHIFLIRSLPDGKFLIWLPILIAWLSDTFAYFTGYFFGKHELIPVVSPKKTVEGSLGGIFGAVLIVVLFQFICAKYFGFKPDYFKGIILAILCSIASQFGDLAASCIKREHNVKDFGSLIPGHGGIFDRFDSVIYISPIVFMAVNYINIL